MTGDDDALPSGDRGPSGDRAAAQRLRAAIDRGETGDKVAFPDPAAAPLGTDDEAAGVTPPVFQTFSSRPGHAPMTIRDIMTTHVDLVGPDTSLTQAARKMREADIGALPVGENDRLVGMLTDRDITIRAVAEGRDPNTTTVRDTVSANVVYVFEDQSTSEAAQIMADHQIRRLPVLNRDKRLVGILALADLARESGNDDMVGQTVESISRPGPR